MKEEKLKAIEEAFSRLRIVLPHIHAAVNEARTEGAAGLAVIAVKPDGSGRLTARFEAEDFFADLATVSKAALCAAVRERDATIARLEADVERLREAAKTAILGRHRDADDLFYICSGLTGCVGSGVKREPRRCPNCNTDCVPVDRRGVPIAVPSGAEPSKSREALTKAIRAFTVDMPNDQPNGPREAQLEMLGEALEEGDLRSARKAHDRMCEAGANDLKALRVAAEEHFGGDFRAVTS